MRLLALLVAALTAGCLFGGPDWYLGGVSASTTLDGPWDRERAEAGLRAAGFEPWPSAPPVVVGNASGELVQATRDPDGRVQLTVEFRVGAQMPSRDAAYERAYALQNESAPRAEALVTAFERGSGWNRTAALTWGHGVLHGD